jgi:hypothetical protein
MSTLLQTAPKGANGSLLYVDDTIAPTHFHNGIPYDGSALAVTTGGAPQETHMGLPMSANGRICVANTTPTEYNDGAMPMVIGRLAIAFDSVSYFNAAVPYSADGRISLTGSGTGVVIVTDPQDIEVSVNFSPTFSVGATGTPPLSYQWERSALGVGPWTPLANVGGAGGFSGVTTNTLTCIQVQGGQDTDRFRCVVTNAVNSATSASAQLLVAS